MFLGTNATEKNPTKVLPCPWQVTDSKIEDVSRSVLQLSFTRNRGIIVKSFFSESKRKFSVKLLMITQVWWLVQFVNWFGVRWNNNFLWTQWAQVYIYNVQNKLKTQIRHSVKIKKTFKMMFMLSDFWQFKPTQTSHSRHSSQCQCQSGLCELWKIFILMEFHFLPFMSSWLQNYTLIVRFACTCKHRCERDHSNIRFSITFVLWKVHKFKFLIWWWQNLSII